MSRVLQPISSCFKKGEISDPNQSFQNPDATTRTEAEKDDTSTVSETNPGLIWRMSSQLYNIGTGAVGIGVGGVKLAGSGFITATQALGNGVISATQVVASKVVPSTTPKPKKE